MQVMLPPEPEPAGGKKEKENVGNDQRVSKGVKCDFSMAATLGRPL